MNNRIIYGMECLNCDSKYQSEYFYKTIDWECRCDNPDVQVLPAEYYDSNGNFIEMNSY